MRLMHLEPNGRLSLKYFPGRDRPAYAVLSHVWGPEGTEVTFQDFSNGNYTSMPGYAKLDFCARRVSHDGLEYFWIDTCCIDKTNAVELSEAINSMFKWYGDAPKCYVYLADVSDGSGSSNAMRVKADLASTFGQSQWFTRGWTLQELIAPREVLFFSVEGTCFGSKRSLERELHARTQIPIGALRNQPLSDFDVEDRLSWAADRKTTRDEDAAYCLQGLFDVYMPLLYGEGDKDMDRLRREINLLSSRHEATKIITSGSQGSINLDDLLESLQYGQIDSRYQTIDRNLRSTCDWLLATEQYQRWLNSAAQADRRGFLWVKGKPGSGKSTLAKYLGGKLGASDKRTILLTFFFHARGDELEKSTAGLYRSLLCQLLPKLPAEKLQSISTRLRLKPRTQWTTKELQYVFETLLHEVLPAQPINIIVDAMDECPEGEIRDMITTFQHISEEAMQSRSEFKVCLFSRHYPYIKIDKYEEIILEEDTHHSADIEKYLQAELKIGKSKQAKEIRDSICSRAQGIFMWVVLVTRILNKDAGQGRLHALRKRLIELPDGLDELFRSIIERDKENHDELILALQWILYAKRPLTPLEFYIATLSGLDPAWEWDEEVVAEADVARFIVSATKGFAEVTKTKNARVQFIHESVRDFLFKSNDDFALQSFNLDKPGHCHDRLKTMCLSYISSFSDPSAVGNSCQDEALTEAERRLHRAALTQQYPFIEYAVRYALFHADSAQAASISQKDLSASFPTRQWIRVHDTLERYNTGRLGQEATWTHILATTGCLHLVKANDALQPFEEQLDQRKSLSPFVVAILQKHRDVAISFLAHIESQFPNEHTREKHRLMCTEIEHLILAAKRPQSIPGHRLVNFLAKYQTPLLFETWTRVQGQHIWHESAMAHALETAVMHGNHDTATLIVQHQDMSIFLGGRLSKACTAGDACGVKYLLSIIKNDLSLKELVFGPKIEVLSSAFYRSILHSKSETAELVLSFGAVDGVDVDSAWTTLLLDTTEPRDEYMAECLIRAKAIANGHVVEYYPPLYKACRDGSERLVRILVAVGADLNWSHASWSTRFPALCIAYEHRHYNIIEILVGAGAQTEPLFEEYPNAIVELAGAGHNRSLESLLRSESVRSSQAGNLNAALHRAVAGGHVETIKSLTLLGADVNSMIDDVYPIQRAARRGHVYIVIYLLQQQATLEDRLSKFQLGQALGTAVADGHSDVAQILKAAGANLREIDGFEGWPNLHNAIYNIQMNGYEDVQDLLDEGADPQLVVGEVGSAMHMALSLRDWKLVEMLRAAIAKKSR